LEKSTTSLCGISALTQGEANAGYPWRPSGSISACKLVGIPKQVADALLVY